MLHDPKSGCPACHAVALAGLRSLLITTGCVLFLLACSAAVMAWLRVDRLEQAIVELRAAQAPPQPPVAFEPATPPVDHDVQRAALQNALQLLATETSAAEADLAPAKSCQGCVTILDPFQIDAIVKAEQQRRALEQAVPRQHEQQARERGRQATLILAEPFMMDHPPEPDAFKKGVKAFEEGRFEDAERLFRRVLQGEEGHEQSRRYRDQAGYHYWVQVLARGGKRAKIAKRILKSAAKKKKGAWH